MERSHAKGDRVRRLYHLRILCLVAVAGALACADKLPSGPSELTTGITLYEDANFLGRSGHLTTDVRDLKDFTGPCEHTSTDANGIATTIRDWNDCASSIRVAPGWRVEVYRDDDFKGQSLSATQDVPNLQLVPGTCDHDGLNDCITSVRIFRPGS
jgi:hypothetical protein